MPAGDARHSSSRARPEPTRALGLLQRRHREPAAVDGEPVGESVGECFIKLYTLERACQAQIMALSAGDNVNNPPQGAAETAGQQGAAGLPMVANLLAWPALKRKAYRLDPSFAT